MNIRVSGAVGLTLFAAALPVTAPALARHVAAASAAPELTVVGHVSAYLATERNPGRDHTAHQLTLRIIGSDFVPGSRVGIAVMNAARWDVLATGSTHAQRATTQVICGHDFKTCSQPNPRAGTFSYRVWLSPVPRAADLLVLYRTDRDAGMQGIILR
jgi:hypothetical protein